MKAMIEKNSLGCDFLLRFDISRKGKPIKLLQLTDPQIIDSSQAREPMIPDRAKAFGPDMFDAQCGNHIRSLIAQSRPDFIFITGDIIYGKYDDNGNCLQWITNLMDSFEIPWAPVFGNHDNESKIGVDRQCKIFESAKYCLFKRGSVSGNGNYSVGIAKGTKLVRVIHLLDSNGCTHSDEPSVIKKPGIYRDQLELINETTRKIKAECGCDIPAFMAFHIPHAIFVEAEKAKGYVTPERYNYIIGVDVEAKDGDFGFKLDSADTFATEGNFLEFAKNNNIDGIFIGHHHNTATTINYQGITLVYGLKTGQYDSYIPGNIGGTLITLCDKEFTVLNISSLCKYGPVPHGLQRYNGFFVEE